MATENDRVSAQLPASHHDASATSREISTTNVAGTQLGGRQQYMAPNRAGKYPWRKRWLGLVPLAALAGFGGWWGWDHVEDRLDERAGIHLACEGIDADELDMDWSYRDVTIAGVLPAGATADHVKQIVNEGSSDTDCVTERGAEAGVDLDVDADPGVYDVNVAALTSAPTAVTAEDPELVEPTAVPEPTATAEPQPTPTEVAEPTAAPIVESLSAQARFDGRTVTLSGVVASATQSQALVATAQAAVGDNNVIDNLEVDEARGADGNDDLVGNLASVVALFGTELLEGSAGLGDGALTWDVLVRDQQTADGQSLPGTGTLDVAVPPVPTFTG